MQCDPKLANRLKRVEGQIRGILRMMEEHDDCQKITTQLLAARSGVDKVLGLVAWENLKQQIDQNVADPKLWDDPAVKKALETLNKAR
jgi:DNA-binding FrmR family transcriptional regulator